MLDLATLLDVIMAKRLSHVNNQKPYPNPGRDTEK